MGHSNVWNSHPKTYDPGSRTWSVFICNLAFLWLIEDISHIMVDTEVVINWVFSLQAHPKTESEVNKEIMDFVLNTPPASVLLIKAACINDD